ncbi:MAG: hypothetical protein WC988_01795 [Patescibacteria group bacterium]
MKLAEFLLDKLNLKKLRFLILSAVLISVCYFLSRGYLSFNNVLQPMLFVKYVSFIALISVLSSLFVQYLSGGDKDIKIVFFTGITPFMLTLGCFLFFVYFPNLSLILKVLTGFFNFILLYTLLLLNNVILVVESREVNIPVYRVAINWVQIVLLSVSLVLFTGIFKTFFQPLIQVSLITASSYIFYQYLIWVYSNDKDIRLLRPLESVILSLANTLLVGWGASLMLFFATESFLRGVFVASVFLLGLGYIQLYLKNALSKKGVWDYLLICSVFLTILVLFRP